MLARSGLSVALIDRSTIAGTALDTDDWDARVYAISPGSAAFLRAVGAWQALPCERVAAVETIRVEGDAGALLEFSAYEMGERALAWIVEERALRAALLTAFRRSGVEAIGGAAPESLAWTAASASLRLADGREIGSRLVIGADGARSWVRAAA